MSRALIVIRTDQDRAKAAKWVSQIPHGGRIEFKGPSRSLDQNALLWSMLTEIATQVEWHGTKLKPDDWKTMFTASKRKARVVPSIEGDGFVVLGMSTSDMSKDEFSDLIELIHAFGAERGVVFHEGRSEQAA